MATVGGAVLAGGSSRRMGRDKALIERDGATLIERVMAALGAGGASPTVVVGGDEAGLARVGLVPVSDRHLGSGPLGGIISALAHLSNDVVVVMACDLLDPSPAAVRAVVDGLGTADVAVPIDEGREQWLHAAWRATVLPELERVHGLGARAPRDAIGDLTVARLPGGDPAWYRDADRPEDLADQPD